VLAGPLLGPAFVERVPHGLHRTQVLREGLLEVRGPVGAFHDGSSPPDEVLQLVPSGVALVHVASRHRIEAGA
jgi:hypothetical protein